MVIIKYSTRLLFKKSWDKLKVAFIHFPNNFGTQDDIRNIEEDRKKKSVVISRNLLVISWIPPAKSGQV